LEFTIELEKASPSAATIAIGADVPVMGAEEAKAIAQMTQNTLYGKGLIRLDRSID
jgi:hypothetical protein